MTAESGTQTESNEIDRALNSWSQGDVALGDFPLLHLKSLQDGEDADVSCENSPGVVIISQTCDVVKKYQSRPLVQIAGLAAIDPKKIGRIQRRQEIRYVAIPALIDRFLVADLDTIMPVDKSVIARMERISGCTSDSERKEFSAALQRYFGRWAFPDDFNRIVIGPLKTRFDKCLKQGDSPEAIAIEHIREIRARPSAEWDAAAMEVELIVIPAESAPTDVDWLSLCSAWEREFKANGQFQSLNVRPAALSDLSAEEYLKSFQIDLDSISISQ